MYAVCIALGASSAYVSVASVPASNNNSSSNDDGDDDVSATSTTAESPFTSCYVVPAIRLVANAAGHRSTPLVASLTAHEVTFGDIAANAYVRQPQTVVPYVFAYAAAAAAVADTQRGGDATPTAAAADALLHIVRAASRVRMAGHCPLDEAALPPQPSAATTAASAQDDACATRGGRPRRLGFYYDADDDGGDGDASSRAFVAAEDLFVRFLNHIKRHVLDAACNLTETSSSSNKDATAAGGGGACSSDKDAATSTTRSRLVVTLVVPRYAFPAAALPSSSSSCAARAAATPWLREALYASHLGAVATHVSVIFRDEAAYLAYTDNNSNNNDNKDNSNDNNNESNTDARRAEDAAVLVVDWGAHALGISVLRERGGLLLDMHAPVQSPRRNHTKQQQHDEEEHEQQQQASCVCPYMCFTSSLPSSSSLPSAPSSYWGAVRVYGGDAVDVALAERVAAQFVTQHRRRLASSGSAAVATLSPALLAHAGRTLGDGDDTTTTTTTTALQQCLPARALRRLRLLMTDKKAALLSNAQATSVAVEVEAFADGIDLLDTQTLSRYKLDAAMRGEWAVAAQLTRALQSFVARNATLLRACAVREVVLVGGMCQVASTAAQLLRQVVTQQLQHAVLSSSSLTVRDATMTRLGGAALSSEEVVVVGGCYHSVHIAWTLQRERATRQRVRAITRKLHNKNSGSGGGNNMARAAAGGRATAAAAATRAHKTALLQLSAVRHAMCDYGTSKNNGDDDDDDNDDAASSGDAAAAMQQQQQQQQQLLHRGRCVAFLTRNVYVYSDADVTALQQCLRATTTAADKAASDEVTRAHARVRLARGALSRLFARNTPLPSRVVVPLPPRDERSDVTRARGDAVVLYLFTDDDDDSDDDKGGRAVQDDDAATTATAAAAVTTNTDGDAMLSLRALTPHGVVVPRTRRARDAVAVDNAARTAVPLSSTDNNDDVVDNALVLTVQMHMDDDGAQRAVLSVRSVVQQSPSHDASAQTTTSPPPRNTVVVYATDVTL